MQASSQRPAPRPRIRIVQAIHVTRFAAGIRALLRDSAAFRLAGAVVLLTGLLLWLNWQDPLVVRMEIESASDQGAVAIYYDDGKGLREATSVTRALRKGTHRYELGIPATRIHSFRIDPATHDQVTRVAGIEALSRGRVIKRFDVSALHPANDIAHTQVEHGGRGLRFAVRPGGADPYFMVADSALQASAPRLSWMAAMLFTAAMVIVSAALVTGLAAGAGRDGAAPLFRFGAVVALVLAIALLAATTHSVSPDEFNHLDAARFYLDRWLPAKIGDPDTLSTYSIYGFSYLNEPDVVYLAAAKFVVATGFLGIDETIRFRLFNVSLLLLCALLATQRRYAFWLTLPLLCTPQAWYVFAYFNSDAFALTAATLLAAWVLAHFERVEAAPATAGIDWKAVACIGVLLALVFLGKKTFYPFIVFITTYALWRSGYRHRAGYVIGFAGLLLLLAWHFSAAVSPAVAPLLAQPTRMMIAMATLGCLGAAAWLVLSRGSGPAPRALIVAAVVAVAVIGLRFAVEAAVNGLPAEQSRAVYALAERIARADFRPSTMGSPQSYFGLALAWKGVTLWEMLFSRFSWASNVAASFFGVYGYMNVIGPAWLYKIQWLLGLALLASVVAASMRHEAARGPALLGLGCMVFAVVLSMVYSWVRDLQAQGRYVLVLLPIVGVMAAEAGRMAVVEGTALRVARAVAMLLWLLAMASFVFVGLPGMARA